MRCRCSAPPVELLANWEQVVKWVDDQPVDVEIDYDNSGTLHVFELRIGMNEFDHRNFFPRWRHSSTGGAVHQHRRGLGLNSRSGARFSKVPNLFGLHNSLCIFKTKVSRVTKLCSYFNFYSLYNI